MKFVLEGPSFRFQHPISQCKACKIPGKTELASPTTEKPRFGEIVAIFAIGVSYTMQTQICISLWIVIIWYITECFVPHPVSQVEALNEGGPCFVPPPSHPLVSRVVSCAFIFACYWALFRPERLSPHLIYISCITIPREEYYTISYRKHFVF